MSETRKKLIEVYIPLDDIATALRLEPYTWNSDPDIPKKWWPRRSQTAWSAITFASMVDDPASCPDEFPTVYEQNAERKRLHGIIHDMTEWLSVQVSESKMIRAQNDIRYQIARSIARLYHEEPPEYDDPDQVLQYLRKKPLPVYDPIVDNESILTEMQRLRFASVASDINPLGVLINKALVETPPKYVGRAPINPDAYLSEHISWQGASGMAKDIQYYGRYIRDEALNRIGHLYPKVISDDGTESTITAWLWARTMPCPDCGFAIPLLRSFKISAKKNNQHWVLPRVDQKTKTISFVVQNHDKDIPKQGTVTRYRVTCLACHTSFMRADVNYMLQKSPMSAQMIAMISEDNRKTMFLSPTDEHIQIALSVKYDKNFTPQQKTPITPCIISRNAYGVRQWYNLFTERQIMALTTFGDLLADAKMQMIKDGADMKYADAVGAHLALSISKDTHGCSSYVKWVPKSEQFMGIYGLEATPIICDFVELNPFSDLSRNWMRRIKLVSSMLERLPQDVDYSVSDELDASKLIRTLKGPAGLRSNLYYGSINQTELSDFFYASLWPILCNVYPGLFAGILAKPDDTTMAPRLKMDGKNPVYRFEKLMGNALYSIRDSSNSGFPSSLFYKHSPHEEILLGETTTGWGTMLSALISAGLQIVGIWPMRSNRDSLDYLLTKGTSPYTIILVCRERASDAKVATRQQFVDELRHELPRAIRHMQDSGIVPSELAQSAIGPGMAVFTRYHKVSDIDGNPVPLQEAIAIIKKTLGGILAERDTDFDDITRRAISWFEQYGFAEIDISKAEGELEESETLSDATNTDMSNLTESGILKSDADRARLLKPLELPKDWNKDKRLTIWEITHHLIRIQVQYRQDVAKCFKKGLIQYVETIHTLDQQRGNAITNLMSSVISKANAAQDLAYRLYDICQRKNLLQEASEYNILVYSWPEIIQHTKPQHNTSDELKGYDKQ